ncbi:MAG TPA: hypothetical protein VMW24_03185, partial [Sedimentisphaerales bacterium]|nr:hypothetical protein [Sedimentisphaerales bacterium]
KPAEGDRTASEQPSPIRYLNDVLGVYVGDRQPSGKTQVILHGKDRSGPRGGHFVNGKRIVPHEWRSGDNLFIGEVELVAENSIRMQKTG